MSELGEKHFVSPVENSTVHGKDLLDRNFVAGVWPKVIKEFGHTLFSSGIGSERIDDPHLAEFNGGGQSSALRITGDELDVLNSATLPFRQHLLRGPSTCCNAFSILAYIRNYDGADDTFIGEVPQTQGVIRNFTQTWLQDGKGNNEIGGKNDIFVPIDGQTMRIEGVLKNVGV